MELKIRLAYKNVTACELYRIILPSNELKDDFEFVREDKTRMVRRGDQIVEVKENADLVVFPRPSHHLIPEIIPHLQAKGIAVVCEIDDDIRSISPQHAGWHKFQPHLNSEFNWRAVEKSCNMADRVVVTTEALAERYGKHGRVDVIPNYIPRKFIDWSKAQNRDNRDIIWPGMIHSHPNDLRQVGFALKQVISEGGKFFHLGSGDAEKQIGTDDFEYIGKCSLDDYYKIVGEHGVGIAPLENSKFNDAKSWLKPLEFAALGMPWVASASPEYKKLAALGCGSIAKRPRQWYSYLNRLITDNEFYNEEQQKCWQVAEKLTVEEHAYKWGESWIKAINYRNGQ